MSSKAKGQTSDKTSDETSDETRGQTTGETTGETRGQTSSRSPISIAQLEKEQEAELHIMQHEALELDRKKQKLDRKKQKLDMENHLYEVIDKVFRNKLLSFKGKDKDKERKNLMHCIKKSGKSIFFKNVDCEDDGKCRRSVGFDNYCIPANKKFNQESEDFVENAKMSYFDYLTNYLMEKKVLREEDFSKFEYQTHDELQESINKLLNKEGDFEEEIEIQRKKETEKVKGGKKKTRRKTITKRKRRKTHRKLKKH